MTRAGCCIRQKEAAATAAVRRKQHMRDNTHFRLHAGGNRAAWGMAFLMIGAAALFAGGRSELTDVRDMEISAIDVSELADGSYQGTFSYSNTNHTVIVEIVGGAIVGISVAEGSETTHGIQGRSVLERVIAEQRTDVDAVSGATTTSKAYLKAVEQALFGEPVG
jgi:uncharacterized protein with FMN-binding domain